MSSRKVILISILMGIALIGLIGLQVNWIRHDFMLKQDKFQRQVKLSLDRAISKLETKATVHLITSEMNGFFNDSMKAYFSSAGLPFLPENELLKEQQIKNLEKHGLNINSINDSTEFSRIEIVGGDGVTNDKLVIEIKQDLQDHKEELIRIEQELSQATGDIQIQKEALQKIKDEQQLESQRLRKADKISKVYDKMIFEYNFKDSVMLERLVPEALDSLISIELSQNGINLPYRLKYSSANEGMAFNSDVNSEFKDSGLVVSALIFPDGIIDRDDTVSLIFSDTAGFFLSSMWLMLLSSALFTVIIILAFSYTVMIIFRQKKLSEMKNDFINNMTHEFKTPITTIRLAANAIGREEVYSDKDKLNYYTNIIVSENNRMNDQVENILQIAQFDKSTFTAELTRVDIADVVKNAVLMMQLHAEQKGGTIQIIDHTRQSDVMADRRFIPMVFLNLIDNAIKYCEKEPLVTITLSETDQELIISVKDNGIGMDNDKRQRVFDKFYRVPSGNIHNVKGFGLGLSYVKAIVTAHHGKIELKSEQGAGSEFIISLPLSGTSSEKQSSHE